MNFLLPIKPIPTQSTPTYDTHSEWAWYRWWLHCALSLAAQCITIGPVFCLWVCEFMCLWGCYHDNSKLRASILTKLGLYVYHLQLIKFWPSSAPGKGVCGGVETFGSALLQPARCLRLSERFFHLIRNSFALTVCWEVPLWRKFSKEWYHFRRPSVNLNPGIKVTV